MSLIPRSFEDSRFRGFLVGNVPPYRGGRYWMFVKLVTDEEVEGVGEWTAGAQVGREESQAEAFLGRVKSSTVC